MFARIRDFMCMCVCFFSSANTHKHTLACLSVCGCKKIDLGSVTAGPAGIRGLNGCLSQRNTHTLSLTCTHTYRSQTPSPSWTRSEEYRFRLLSR